MPYRSDESINHEQHPSYRRRWDRATTDQASRKGNRRLYIAAAIITAAALTSASILYVTTGQVTITKTETTTLTVSPTTSSTNASAEAGILATCSQAIDSGQFPTVVVGTKAATVLCVQVYDYNYTSTYTFNVSGALNIDALKYPPNSEQIAFDGASNFTVIASPNELVIGGPNSENEGAVIAYALTARPGASGTYELDFPSFSYNFPGLDSCGYYGEIVTGNGEPSYLNTGFTGCITYSVSNTAGAVTNGTKYTVIDDRVLINGGIYFHISGIANYTQNGGTG